MKVDSLYLVLAETIRGAVSDTALYYIRKVRGSNFPSGESARSGFGMVLVISWLVRRGGLAGRPTAGGIITLYI